MKKLLLLILLFFISCEQRPLIEQTTTNMELRQLINKEEKIKSSQGSYFVIMAVYSSSEKTEDVIKMFVKVDSSYYKMLKLNLEQVNIVIDNKINKPYLKIIDNNIHNRKLKDFEIIRYTDNDEIYLYCPEKYLPEKILEINLN